MWSSEHDRRKAKVDKKILKVKSALSDSVRERNKAVHPKIYLEICDFIEELLEDLSALLLRRRLLDDA